jgi:hypothetical protein
MNENQSVGRSVVHVTVRERRVRRLLRRGQVPVHILEDQLLLAEREVDRSVTSTKLLSTEKQDAVGHD